MSEELILIHHGVKGMKWGIRRYQNKDGSLTAAGKRKYSEERDDRTARSEKRGLTANQKKALKTGAVVVGTVLAVYGGYKLSKAVDVRSSAVASHVGDVFADRFATDIGAKGVGPGGNYHQRAAAGVRSRGFAKEASGYFNNQVADSIANRRGVGKLQNAANYYKLKAGKKTPFDLYDYQRMASTSVSKSGAFDKTAYEQLRKNAQTSQEAHDEWRYAALLIDAVNSGGQIPFKRLDKEASRWVTAN